MQGPRWAGTSETETEDGRGERSWFPQLCMGGVNISDTLTGYHHLLHKTRRWYKTLFFHLMDVAVVNAFLLHKEQCKLTGVGPLTQKAFRETLAEQLMDLGSRRGASAAPGLQHRLTYITQDRRAGRQRCRMCQFRTSVKCATCDKPLCFVPTRDSYNRWHTRVMQPGRDHR